MWTRQRTYTVRRKKEGKVILFIARIALARAAAEAENRRAMQLSKAAEKVKDKHTCRAGGNGDDSSGEESIESLA